MIDVRYRPDREDHMETRSQNSTGYKLDLLMRLTGSRNAELGEALSFDASYISRIRNGKRSLPADPEVIGKAAAYFAGRVTASHERAAAADAVGLASPWPEDRGEAEALVARWLSGEPLSQAGESSEKRDHNSYLSSGRLSEAAFYFGNEGKRQAVMSFLAELERSPAGTMLIYSDEDMTWLYEDARFGPCLRTELAKLLAAGWRIRIIHSLGRDRTEMWEGVKQWLPMYLLGNFEPFYSPRLRDSLTTRSLFVAEGCCAMLASTVKGQNGEGLCMIIKDPGAISAAAREFGAYLAQCRPLMDIREGDRQRLAQTVRELASDPDSLIFLRLRDSALIVRLPEDPGQRLRGSALVVRLGERVRSFLFSEMRLVEAVAEFAEGDGGTLHGAEAASAAEAFAKSIEDV
jgi:hypothetical protein